ncbi:hypothetical protein HC766_00770 [Candidatus Gracilibacteria bacterium]|nr:hypothetical protein [Candidatus Gracilibacteria bacterium]
MQLPNGEQFIVACPTKNTNFNVGSVFVGLGYGSSSDKLPKDCVKLVQRSQQRYSMYDAMRAACHLGPGSFQSFNKHLFASSMAEIKGTTLADELRLMRTADVNVQKVSALDTYNAFCKVNMSEQKEFMPVQPPEPPYIPSTPTPTKVNH